jgi:hypothetical protein
VDVPVNDSEPYNQKMSQMLATAVGDTVTLSVTEDLKTTSFAGGGHSQANAQAEAFSQIFLSTDNPAITFVSESGALYTAPAPAAWPLFGAGLSTLMLRLRRRAR